ncbi:ribosome biogenesis GTPase Der [Mesomycoplasma lagogenitalium]|uniref:GTPase Der n=1 Tax=Mesomycoplasma lagogenitalium TaxID=171286 RepID=A0ABY8LT78_9BACT|nr:ribosome biogenesis GTPase Der [Mesomycoplasma lagogenitalium]WGI36443.1 ribosome biogenesis GTPase Der [Mesomycoplasma lagogenitalium]
MNNNVVAIVGKPNVGKSTLFNKLIGKRVSIVYDQPGVTRDRLYEEIQWLDKKIKVIDTGGIEIEDKPFQEQIRVQAQIAIEEAQVIILVLDGRAEIDKDDFFVVNMLRKSGKKIVVCCNKLEGNKDFDYSIYKLGFEKYYPISAIHSEGIGDLLDEVINHLDFSQSSDEGKFKLSIIGKPNAGKSSLLNALLKENRSIVSPIAGTTRDSIVSQMQIEDQIFTIIDTAGITRKSKLVESVDHYALMRAMSSLAESDLSLIIIDATKELSHFDSRLAGYAFEENKPIILVVNKWDLIHKETNTMAKFEKDLRKNYKFLDWAPVVFISAINSNRLEKLKEQILLVKKNLERKISANLLNEVLVEIQVSKPAPSLKGKRLEISFIKQVDAKIPTFLLFVNNKEYAHFSYLRYLENQLREYFDFRGTPLKLILKNKNEKNTI